MVEILDETSAYPQAKALQQDLQQALETLMHKHGLADRELTVVLVSDAAIQRLNRAHREEDTPTDVLSYPSAEPGDIGMPQIPHLGDIIISVETAARQAAEHHHDTRSEIKVLAAHGLMHLMGYDHDTEDAWQIFEKAQKLILE